MAPSGYRYLLVHAYQLLWPGRAGMFAHDGPYADSHMFTIPTF